MPLVFDLSTGNIGAVVGGAIRWRLHAEGVTEQPDLSEGVAVTLPEREGEVRDARRCNHRQARPPVQLVIQDVPKLVIAHAAAWLML
jgi:hypothetical protein